MIINTKKLFEKKYCEKIFMDFLKKKIIKENSSLRFEKNLNKALNNLEFANFIFDEHNHSIKEKLPHKTYYDWCITIYYYAIYHAILALAAKARYESKNHLATISIITLFYYHKDNVLKREEIEFLIDKIQLDKQDINLVIESKDMRERACYGTDELFELRQAKLLQIETSEFINKVRSIVE